MQALVTAFAFAALGEIGDKTQLLALALAGRYRRPGMVLVALGMAAGLNHLLAAALGAWIAAHLQGVALGWMLAAAFFVLGVFALRGGEPSGIPTARTGRAFWVSSGLFFVAEMGDKTQVATALLAARFSAPLAVALGTTAGMLLTDGLTLYFGGQLFNRLGTRWTRRITAGLCFVYGLVLLLSPAGTLGAVLASRAPPASLVEPVRGSGTR